MTEDSPYATMATHTRSGELITETDLALDLMVRGVYVITTRYNERMNGFTAAMATRVSGVPIYLMVAAWEQNYSRDLIADAGFFALNILAEDGIDLAKHFGRQSGRDVDKFKREDIYWQKRVTGAPILLDALAYCDCRLIDSYTPPVGDHTIFIGEVVDANILRNDVDPLRYNRGDYPYRVLNINA